VADHLGLIWLAIEPPLAPLPDLPGWNEDGFVSARCETVRTPVSALQLIDNFMDAAHFPFVHPNSFGVEDAFEVSGDDVTTDEWVVRSTFSAPYQNHDDPLVSAPTMAPEVGVRCSINADDPLLFGPSMLDEYELCRREFGLSDTQLADIARTSIECGGAPESVKTSALTGIDAWLAAPVLP
jgi:phenylpropionate dioxygenase-like ring-hydroxylating dioxygenase large terminal subunit